MNKKVIAIILARGGSKGIPNKNISSGLDGDISLTTEEGPPDSIIPEGDNLFILLRELLYGEISQYTEHSLILLAIN